MGEYDPEANPPPFHQDIMDECRPILLFTEENCASLARLTIRNDAILRRFLRSKEIRRITQSGGYVSVIAREALEAQRIYQLHLTTWPTDCRKICFTTQWDEVLQDNPIMVPGTVVQGWGYRFGFRNKFHLALHFTVPSLSTGRTSNDDGDEGRMRNKKRSRSQEYNQSKSAKCSSSSTPAELKTSAAGRHRKAEHKDFNAKKIRKRGSMMKPHFLSVLMRKSKRSNKTPASK